MVFIVGSLVQSVIITSNTGDDGALGNLTSCMGDASCAVSCYEVKQSTNAVKFEKDSVAVNMTSVTMRVCVQSIMTAGTNTFYAYTDANSVTATNHQEYGGNLSTGDNDLALSAAFVDEILTTNFTVRLISEFGSKNKVGEMSVQYTIPLSDLDGITKDDDDNIVTSRGCVLMRRSGGSSPYTWTQIDSTTSNGTTGAYSFSYEDDGSEYRVFAQNSDGTKSDITPEVQGV